MERGSTILTAVVAGAISGALGGLTAGWVRPREAKPTTASRSAVADEVAELRAEVGALREEVARLEKQRKVTSPAAVAAAATAAPTGAGAGRALQDDPVFEAAVRDVMERTQQDRADERDTRRAQRWVDQVAETAQLSEAQKPKILAIAQEFLQGVREMRDADAGAAGPRGEARKMLRATTEQRLAEVLSPQQMDAYRAAGELRIDTALRGWGGRSRGGQDRAER